MILSCFSYKTNTKINQAVFYNDKLSQKIGAYCTKNITQKGIIYRELKPRPSKISRKLDTNCYVVTSARYVRIFGRVIPLMSRIHHGAAPLLLDLLPCEMKGLDAVGHPLYQLSYVREDLSYFFLALSGFFYRDISTECSVCHFVYITVNYTHFCCDNKSFILCKCLLYGRILVRLLRKMEQFIWGSKWQQLRDILLQFLYFLTIIDLRKTLKASHRTINQKIQFHLAVQNRKILITYFRQKESKT